MVVVNCGDEVVVVVDNVVSMWWSKWCGGEVVINDDSTGLKVGCWGEGRSESGHSTSGLGMGGSISGGVEKNGRWGCGGILMA
jgi:hypothetical protein